MLTSESLRNASCTHTFIHINTHRQNTLTHKIFKILAKDKIVIKRKNIKGRKIAITKDKASERLFLSTIGLESTVGVSGSLSCDLVDLCLAMIHTGVSVI